MKEINFYKEKCDTLYAFYDWLDTNRTEHITEYDARDVVVDQTIYYSIIEDDLENIIMYITLGTIYARWGRKVHNLFREDLENVIKKYRTLDIEQYTLSKEEKEVLEKEIKEIEMMLQE